MNPTFVNAHSVLNVITTIILYSGLIALAWYGGTITLGPDSRPIFSYSVYGLKHHLPGFGEIGRKKQAGEHVIRIVEKEARSVYFLAKEEKQRNGGRLSPERQAYYEAELDKIARKGERAIDAIYRKGEETPGS